MRILSWNVNGIRSILNAELNNLIVQYKPDVLCLQETKIDLRVSHELKYRYRREFDSFWHIGGRRGYSGMGLLVSKDYSVSENVAGLQVEEVDVEARVQMVNVAGLRIINAYFPHSHRDLRRLPYKLTFLSEFTRYVARLNRDGGNILIAGDLNIAHMERDLFHFKNNKNNAGFRPEERRWMDEFLESGYVDCFRLFNADSGHYTWWGQTKALRERNVGWRLDYFLASTNLSTRVQRCQHLNAVTGSDHCPVLLDIAFP
ncbi:MAG: exodeoxyribonuclease III [Flavobacteriales bacterium]|nr:exodeoxyribonuclease III [Flavobacteriales bacterium]